MLIIKIFVKFVGQAFCLIGNPKWKGEPLLQAFNENRSVLVNWTGIIYNAKGGHGRDCTDNFRFHEVKPIESNLLAFPHLDN